jgi:hypothetical protein
MSKDNTKAVNIYAIGIVYSGIDTFAIKVTILGIKGIVQANIRSKVCGDKNLLLSIDERIIKSMAGMACIYASATYT